MKTVPSKRITVPRFHFKLIDIDTLWYEVFFAVHMVVLLVIILPDPSTFLSNLDAWIWAIGLYTASVLVVGVLVNYTLNFSAPIVKHKGSSLIFLYPKDYGKFKLDLKKVNTLIVNPRLFYVAFAKSPSQEKYLFEYSIEEEYFTGLLSYIKHVLPNANVNME